MGTSTFAANGAAGENREISCQARRDTVKISVKFFSHYEKLAGTGKLTVELPDGATLAGLIRSLREELDSPVLVVERTLAMVNQKRTIPETILKDGDEVSVFHILGGG
jgi:molybdopterin converting factor small subunit